MGSPILWLTLHPHQGCTPPNSHPSDPHAVCWTKPLRPVKPAIHRHSRSPQATPLRPAQACTTSAPPDHTSKACQTDYLQACTISIPPVCAPQAWQASDPQACKISTLLGPHPSGTPGPCSKGLLNRLNDRPPLTSPWDPTHLPPATEGLQTCLGDTDRSRY
jgi:hypothetical protein